MHGLSKIQKRDIARLCRTVYLAWPERVEFEAANPELSATKCFEAWRHVEQGKAVGIQSLCECTQAHFQPLVAHFRELLGDAEGAQRARDRDADNGRRIALFKLRETLRERELTEGYAAAICRRQFRCELNRASVKQVWCLVYTVRNRRPAVTTTATDGNPF